MNNNEVKNTVKSMVETINYFNWKLTQIWVENNCIYGERIRANGDKQTEGLFAGADDYPQDTYDIFNSLKYTLNFNGILNNDNVLI